MSSAMADLVGDVVAALLAGPALAGGFVKEGRAFPLPAEVPAGLFVRLVRSRGASPHAGTSLTDWDSAVSITGMARGTSSLSADSAADDLLVAVHERLNTLADPAAGVWLGDRDINYDIEEADQTLAGFELRITAQHRTNSGSLAAAA